MKKIVLLLFAGLFLAACGNQPQGQAQDTLETSKIEQLAQNPMQFDGQVVRFEGIVGHVCQTSGDKMRVRQPDDDAFSMQVMLGDMKDHFNASSEGTKVMITGKLVAELANMAELEDDHDHEEGHECESTEAAIRLMEERGISPNIRLYVDLQAFELI